MPQLSVQARLNLLIGALLVLALAVNAVSIIGSAGPRIRAEQDSILAITLQTLERGLPDIAASPEPPRALAELIERLSGVRHVTVWVETPALRRIERVEARQQLENRRVPVWFANLVYAERPPVRVPLDRAIEAGASLVVASNPADEIAEIWKSFTETMAGGLALIAAVFALTSLAVRQALRPIGSLRAALRSMQGGDYGIVIDPSGPPELAEISAALNNLARTLHETRSENRRLAEHIISLADIERRELARELHDEFGPYLFAIRATITALQSDAHADRQGQAAPGDRERAKKCEAALNHVAALQSINRRILERLRPPALSDLGLEGALQGLAALWRENHPGVAITLTVNTARLTRDDTLELTIYRVVQEGLTNVFRHANATLISVIVDALYGGPIVVRVTDNGTGLSDESKPGFGLSGMAERVWALGGTMTMTNGADGGFVLAVELPHSGAHTDPQTT